MKKMLLVLMMMPISIYAQRIERDEVDKYTKAHIKETSWFILKMRFASQLSCRLKKINDNYRVELSVSYPAAFNVSEGNHIIMLFDDEVTIKLNCVRGGVGHYVYSKYASYWNEKLLYEISQSDMKLLTTKSLIGVRIELGGEYDEFEGIKEKNQIKLQSAAKNILEEWIEENN